jgi:hypothetical protein
VLDCIARAKLAIKPPSPPQKETVEERIKRGAFLRAAVAKAQATDAIEVAKQALGTKRWRRLAALWAQAGKLEAEERDLLFTLHAMGEGEAEFDFYYLDLYRLLFPCDGSELYEGRLTSSARQRIRRRFDNLEKAEHRCGIQFAKLDRGYKDDEGCHPSHIRLWSADYADQIESLALTDPQYNRSKRAAFDRAIGKFVEFKTSSQSSAVTNRRETPSRKSKMGGAASKALCAPRSSRCGPKATKIGRSGRICRSTFRRSSSLSSGLNPQRLPAR